MQKRKIKIDKGVLNKITSSEIMTDSEKLSFMKYI
jgi:hypothetical protein